MSITDKERAVLIAVLTNDYCAFNGQIPHEGYVFDAGDWQVWADCIDCASVTSALPSGNALSGVVSSLCKKGLLTSDGECVCFTAEGYKRARRTV